MAKENRRGLMENTPSSCGSPSFTWSWDPRETRSLMTVMGVRLIEENVPSEQPDRSPPHKHPRPCRGKENQAPRFLVCRRFRKGGDTMSDTSCSCDDLPDELLLVIFRSLSLSHLLKASRVSRRWHRLAFDKSLWYSVDLSKGSLPPGTIGQVLGAGVVVFRSPRSFLGNPNFKDDSPLCVQHMDLSHSVLSHSSISQILARCRHLLGLSLEGLALSDDVVRDIGHNEGLLRLNLSTCSHFSPHTLAQTLSHCPRLDELNISWCQFSSPLLQVIIGHLPGTVTQLNISGYRHGLYNADVQVLCGRCPRITNLDLSDSTMLTASCLPALQRLSHLQHLGLSRCHEIPVAALVDLGEIATLKTLNIYGLLRDCAVNVKDIIPRININSFPLTTIARPTHGSGQTNTIWGMVCQLKLHSL